MERKCGRCTNVSYIVIILQKFDLEERSVLKSCSGYCRVYFFFGWLFREKFAGVERGTGEEKLGYFYLSHWEDEG